MILIIILLILLFLLLSILTPTFWVLCGKLFKVPDLTFVKAFKTFFVATLISLVIQLSGPFLVYLGLGHPILDLILAVTGFIIVLWYIKNSFEISYPKTIVLHISTLIVVGCFALSIRTYAIQAFKIPSGAMRETIEVGDQILVNKFFYKFKQPKSGDIVVFKFPEDPAADFIKRVVAIGGDTIEIRDKEIIVNGKRSNQPYAINNDLKTLPASLSPRDNMALVSVPDDSIFVMGDNRDNSYDSRFWGVVKNDALRGKAFIIYWSWDRMREKIRWSRIGKSL